MKLFLIVLVSVLASTNGRKAHAGSSYLDLLSDEELLEALETKAKDKMIKRYMDDLNDEKHDDVNEGVQDAGNKGYKSIGCYRDSSGRPAFPESLEGKSNFLDGQYWNRVDPIKKCYLAAAQGKNYYFGIRNGECFSGCAAGITYYRNSKADNCNAAGTGGAWALNVYQITKNAGGCTLGK